MMNAPSSSEKHPKLPEPEYVIQQHANGRSLFRMLVQAICFLPLLRTSMIIPSCLRLP